MSDRKPWEPSLDTPEDTNPFANRTQGEGKFTKTVRDPEEDTSPLQGSKDVSDEDSLIDVIADASAPPAKKPSNI